MTLKGIISQLIQELEAEKKNAFYTENNSYYFHFEDNIDIEIKELKESILLKSQIELSPKKNEEIFLLKALEANLFGVGTEHAVIGLEENQLILSRELDDNISYEDFKEKLGKFIHILHYWRLESTS